ncbi:hypothetical protein [Streptomyces sp. NPDC057690]|uniref:hypothetical protein n=1 Tax=Streptomyces sp. NPDC057690 TaxID=3346214 RepID=UPI0036B0C2CE
MSENTPEHAGGLVGVYQRKLETNGVKQVQFMMVVAVMGYVTGLPIAAMFTDGLVQSAVLGNAIAVSVMSPFFAFSSMLHMLSALGSERRAALARTGWAVFFLPAAVLLPAGKDVEWLRWVLESLEFRADCKAPYRTVISSIIFTYPQNFFRDWAATFRANRMVFRQIRQKTGPRALWRYRMENPGWEGKFLIPFLQLAILMTAMAAWIAGHRILLMLHGSGEPGLLRSIGASWREFRGHKWLWRESAIMHAGRWALRKAGEWNVAWWFAIIAALLVMPLEHIATYYMHLHGYVWWYEIIWPLG